MRLTLQLALLLISLPHAVKSLDRTIPSGNYHGGTSLGLTLRRLVGYPRNNNETLDSSYFLMRCPLLQMWIAMECTASHLLQGEHLVITLTPQDFEDGMVETCKAGEKKCRHTFLPFQVGEHTVTCSAVDRRERVQRQSSPFRVFVSDPHPVLVINNATFYSSQITNTFPVTEGATYTAHCTVQDRESPQMHDVPLQCAGSPVVGGKFVYHRATGLERCECHTEYARTSTTLDAKCDAKLAHKRKNYPRLVIANKDKKQKFRFISNIAEVSEGQRYKLRCGKLPVECGGIPVVSRYSVFTRDMDGVECRCTRCGGLTTYVLLSISTIWDSPPPVTTTRRKNKVILAYSNNGIVTKKRRFQKKTHGNDYIFCRNKSTCRSQLFLRDTDYWKQKC